MLSRVQGKKVHQVHFALDVAVCLNLDAVHVIETFVEEGVQVVLRCILNEPCSLNLKFNTPLKPWVSSQCSGSSQPWI